MAFVEQLGYLQLVSGGTFTSDKYGDIKVVS